MKRIALLAVLSIAPLVNAQNIPVPSTVCTDTTWATMAVYLNAAISTDLNWGGYLKSANQFEDRHVIYHMATMSLINDQAIQVIGSCGIAIPAFAWPQGAAPNQISPRGLFVDYIQFDAVNAQKDLAPFAPNYIGPAPNDPDSNIADVARQLNDMDISMSLYQEQPYLLIYPQ